MAIVVNGKDGKSGRLFVKNVTDSGDYIELIITQWEATEMATEYETTGSKSAGNNEYEYGSCHIEGSVTAEWDSSINPIQDGPTIRASGGPAGEGDNFALRAFLNSSPGAAGTEDGYQVDIDGSSGFARFNNVKLTVPAEGKISYSFDFKSSGGYAFTETHS